jgi:hypothetical protein
VVTSVPRKCPIHPVTSPILLSCRPQTRDSVVLKADLFGRHVTANFSLVSSYLILCFVLIVFIIVLIGTRRSSRIGRSPKHNEKTTCIPLLSLFVFRFHRQMDLLPLAPSLVCDVERQMKIALRLKDLMRTLSCVLKRHWTTFRRVRGKEMLLGFVSHAFVS